jgi:hypothetical protein
MTRFRSEDAILQPYDPQEAIGIAEAARRAGQAERTLREWCPLHKIGRKIAGRWKISGPALDMLLEGDGEALKAYLSGDRHTHLVRSYFERRGIPLQAEAANT